jgi:ABC-type Fe3+/spermidine/putrescine transport system ATPase subunit
MQAETLIHVSGNDEPPVPPKESSGNNTVVGVEGLSKILGGVTVLKDISFSVAEGESLVLLGASGSGKTTILRIIAGLESADRGRVILQGVDITRLPARERNIGIIFQNYALFPKMTIEQNISFGLRIRKISRKERHETVSKLMELVQLDDHAGKRPSQLSGGQQQRVAIARALAYKPRVLLFDEPFGALDTNTRSYLRREIVALLKRLNVPAIFITHDQEEALEIGDRIAVINKGVIEQIGTPSYIYDHPETEYVATFVGTTNLFSAVIRKGSVEIGTTSLLVNDDAITFTDGQEVKVAFRPEAVCLSKTRVLPDRCNRLGNGIIQDISFAGSVERLRVLVDTGKSQSDARGISFHGFSVRPAATSIIVTRTRAESDGFPLIVGNRVTVGVRAFRILR